MCLCLHGGWLRAGWLWALNNLYVFISRGGTPSRGLYSPICCPLKSLLHSPIYGWDGCPVKGLLSSLLLFSASPSATASHGLFCSFCRCLNEMSVAHHIIPYSLSMLSLFHPTDLSNHMVYPDTEAVHFLHKSRYAGLHGLWMWILTILLVSSSLSLCLCKIPLHSWRELRQYNSHRYSRHILSITRVPLCSANDSYCTTYLI